MSQNEINEGVLKTLEAIQEKLEQLANNQHYNHELLKCFLHDYSKEISGILGLNQSDIVERIADCASKEAETTYLRIVR